jgi:hypothetical protein
MAKNQNKMTIRYRDSITGRFIPKNEADRRPRTTQKESIHIHQKRKKP